VSQEQQVDLETLVHQEIQDQQGQLDKQDFQAAKGHRVILVVQDLVVVLA